MIIISKRKKNHPLASLTGFTLVELIVSIAILATISGLFLANYSSLRKRAGLPAAANKLASDIRTAQSYALGAKKINNQIPLGGWGIYLRRNQSEYTIFADDGTGGGADAEKHDNFDTDYRIFCFAGEVGSCNSTITINTLTGFDNANSGSIVFLPPDPIVYFDGQQAAKESTDPSVTITLRDSSTGDFKNVVINFFGLVEVE
jgi:prepilin-type N-terminal cleavage/methylation domain-containing protein